MATFLKLLYRRYRNLLKFLIVGSIASFLFVRLLNRSWRRNRKGFAVSSRAEFRPSEQAYAYASLLCDDVMIDATKVLIHSLKSTTKLPFILLVLPQVTQTEELVKLGAKLHVISELEYPFKVNQEKVAMNKMCRYSKLHIWKFIQYKKIVFIDVDCLIVQVFDKFSFWLNDL